MDVAPLACYDPDMAQTTERRRIVYRVSLYRNNGRPLREKVVASRYAAKVLRDQWEDRYDWTHTVEIMPVAQ